MNFYESVVVDYLRADRALFLNTECCIQVNPADNPDNSGAHWYCDAVVADFRSKHIFLCEVSYSESLSDLIKRVRGWNENWDAVRRALARDSFLPDWPLRPWLFVPDDFVPLLLKRLAQIRDEQTLKFDPRITPLQMVQPWRYRSFNRIGEGPKPEAIPREMRE
jgi:hypothetical protein